MYAHLVSIGLGFIEGFALILSPCILPILPIILAGSLVGNKRRPLGIIFGFIIVFSLFTLFSRTLVKYSGIDLNLVRNISYGILLLLGFIMMSTYLTKKFTHYTRHLAKAGSSHPSILNPRDDFGNGMIFGGLVAIIWTPCAGPILAAVIVQTVIQETTWVSLFIVLAFALGAAIPMLMIAFFGREILPKSSLLKHHTELFRKLLGFIIILTVGYMVYLGGRAPTFFADWSSNKTASSTLQDGLLTPYLAPPIAGISTWVNSPPLKLNQLRGKVILIDFWTYTCINCIHTIPHINEWYEKYHQKGLVIIGIHSPEYEFEKNIKNVEIAIGEFNIKYPVALDNQFTTWRNYNTKSWPSLYLINKEGYVVYHHHGEGNYAETESNIRLLLGIKDN